LRQWFDRYQDAARGTIVKPAASRLLIGGNVLSDVPFDTTSRHHLFCRHGGVRPFGRGHPGVPGGDFHCINLAWLDDVEPGQLIEASMHVADGRPAAVHMPVETRHL
jgi:hypothetical protein